MSNVIKNHKKLPMLHLSVALGSLCASILAVVLQIFFMELPCPLCFSQRLGIMMAGIGATMSVRSGFSAKNDLIVVIGCMLSLIFSTRQTLLHIMPGDLGFGLPFLGVHLYTWVTIAASSFITAIAISRIWSIKAEEGLPFWIQNKGSEIILSVFLYLAAINVLLSFLQCGLTTCDPSPTGYMIINNWRQALLLV